MDILPQAFAAAGRNKSAVLLLLAITIPVSTLILAGDHFMAGQFDKEAQPAPYRAFGFASDIITCLCGALAQAIAFSRMGREMDKPLWRIQGDGEAIKRFFPLWLILNLIVILPDRLAALIPDHTNSPAIVPLGLLFLGFIVLCVPVGACIMFQGHFRWASLGESLKPLRSQLPQTVGILIFNLLQIFVLFLLMGQFHEARWVYPALWIASTYLDCVVFAAIWIICMIDRDTMNEPHFDL